MDMLKKLLVPLIVLALFVAGGIALFSGGDTKRVVAHFPRTVSIYEGSEVRVLGVPIGEVESVEPSGTDVVVSMRYDADVKIPADAEAAIVAPSMVGDRFVQLTPAYTGGDVMPDNTELSVEQTGIPLELDQIYESLDELNVALGPRGANKDGALSDLLAVTADNFDGQGQSFNETIQNFSRLSDTLENNRDELFGSAARLEGFVKTIADNDRTVRAFNQSLANVSELLAGEREELAASLKNLGIAMGAVSEFVTENRASLGRNIKGLNRVSKVLVKQRAALDEALKAGPLALNNLYLAYNPQSGTLDTRGNLPGENLSSIEADPALFLCSVVGQADKNGALCDTINQILNRPGALRGDTRLPAQEAFDPSLGGLVEVAR